MRKTLYTLNIGNYEPGIWEHTSPLLARYAEKIGAEFYIITGRKWPDWPVTQEKFQIYDLMGKDEWAIYIDADAVVHPDTPDFTEFVGKDTVVLWDYDLTPTKFRYDSYFRRYGQHKATGGWLSFVSDWCRDFWQPLTDMTLEHAKRNITSRSGEPIAGGHQIDSYVCSRNMARYGLKTKTVKEIMSEHGMDARNYFYHNALISFEERREVIKQLCHNLERKS